MHVMRAQFGLHYYFHNVIAKGRWTARPKNEDTAKIKYTELDFVKTCPPVQLET